MSADASGFAGAVTRAAWADVAEVYRGQVIADLRAMAVSMRGSHQDDQAKAREAAADLLAAACSGGPR